MLAPGVMHLIKRTPKPDYQMADVVSLLANAQPHEISLIDGNSNAEGAFIAEMAIHDSGLNHYAVRASKLFAETNFMGSKYQLKFVDPQSVLAEISRLGIKNIVVVRIGESLAFPHSEQLAEALRLPNSQFRKVATLVHGNRYGTTELYKSTAIVVPDIKAVRQLGIPAKASALNQSQLSEARHATLPAQSIQQQPQRLAP
jgi:hypothetical protein